MEEKNNIDNLKKSLKLAVFSMGALLILGTLALFIALGLKKDKKDTAIKYTSITSKQNFPNTCFPIQIEIKENFVVLNSEKCRLIKVINLKTEKITEYEY